MEFIGSRYERAQLEAAQKTGEATMIVVYGRRVEKTMLIEKAFSNRRLLKFDGVEGKSDTFQMSQFMSTLRRHFPDSKL